MRRIGIAATLAVAACVIACALASASFDDFERAFTPSYASPADRMRRRRVFESNMRLAAELNKANGPDPGTGEPVFGMTMFSDLTAEEFASGYLDMNHVVLPRTRFERTPSTNSPLPPEFDWRSASPAVVTPVKSVHRHCHASWAMSAVEAAESAWALASNPLVALSPQQLIDCVHASHGCDGGTLIDALVYSVAAGGLASAQNYPYVGRQHSSCLYSAADKAASLAGFSFATTTRNETEMQAVLYALGPLAACIDGRNLQHYRGGVLRNCGQAPNLCIQLTGWAAVAGVTAWNARLAWGSFFGVGGYVQLALGDDVCGVSREALLVSASAATTTGASGAVTYSSTTVSGRASGGDSSSSYTYSSSGGYSSSSSNSRGGTSSSSTPASSYSGSPSSGSGSDNFSSSSAVRRE